MRLHVPTLKSGCTNKYLVVRVVRKIAVDAVCKYIARRLAQDRGLVKITRPSAPGGVARHWDSPILTCGWNRPGMQSGCVADQMRGPPCPCV